MAKKEVTICDKCGSMEHTEIYRLGRQMGAPRTLDLCKEHAAPLEDLLADRSKERSTRRQRRVVQGVTDRHLTPVEQEAQ